MEKKKYYLILGAIILLALVLRLRGFDERFLLASDTARDLLTARGAVKLGELPWVGSFSSAGPFVFAPNWYWFLMVPAIILPGVFPGPWIILLLISLFFVYLSTVAGNLFGGRKAGLLTGLVAAVSPAAIGFSTYLTQHGLVEICAALALVGFLAFLKTRRPVFALLAGLGVGSAISLHYQGLYLLVYFPIMFLFAPRAGLFFIPGLLVPLVPLLLWDGSRGFRNLEQLIYFYRVGQYRFWVSDRWLTYIGVFWPGFLGKILGGTGVAGAVLGLTVLAAFFRRRFSAIALALFTAMLLQLIALRYLRSERLDGYLVYWHAELVLLAGWSLYRLQTVNKHLGFAVIGLLIFFSLQTVRSILIYNNDVAGLRAVSSQLARKLPGEKVALFGKGLSTSNVSYSLSFVTEAMGNENDGGYPVGICLYSRENCGFPDASELASGSFQDQPYSVIDLARYKDSLTKQNDWYPFSVLAVYDDVQNWWRKGL